MHQQVHLEDEHGFDCAETVLDEHGFDRAETVLDELLDLESSKVFLINDWAINYY